MGISDFVLRIRQLAEKEDCGFGSSYSRLRTSDFGLSSMEKDE
jgi:hypothetical protein